MSLPLRVNEASRLVAWRTEDERRGASLRAAAAVFGFGLLPFHPMLRVPFFPALRLTLEVPDVLGRGIGYGDGAARQPDTVVITFGVEVPEEFPPAHYNELFRALTLDAYAHELDEQLRVDGVRLWDPHKDHPVSFAKHNLDALAAFLNQKRGAGKKLVMHRER